jgi:putative PIN family toxin of toxin-antitoxin system
VPSATFDSNVYVSALVFRQKMLSLLHLAIDQDIEIAISDEIMDETIRVLREKFQWSDDRLEEARTLIAGFTRRVVPTQKLDVVKADPDDNKIVECAVEADSEYLVTGDKGILKLGSYGATQIVTPAQFFEIVVGLQRGR